MHGSVTDSDILFGLLTLICNLSVTLSVILTASSGTNIYAIDYPNFTYTVFKRFKISLTMSESVKREIPKHFFPASFRDAPI